MIMFKIDQKNGGLSIYYLPPRQRSGTGDIATPAVRLSVCPCCIVFDINGMLFEN